MNEGEVTMNDGQADKATHVLEVSVTRWYRVEISAEHLVNTLRDECTDTSRDDDDSLVDWYRRNAGEHALRSLLVDDWGKPMSGATVLEETEHKLVRFDDRQF